jgi:Asp-tRNA(Asn)/Glu-tRNA(Gln) amidotransferase A subunit family amidase
MALSTDAFKAMIRDYDGLNLSDADYGRGRPALDRVGIKAHSAMAGIHTSVGSEVPAKYVPEADVHQRG